MRSFKHRIGLIRLSLFMVVALSAGQAAAQVPKPNVVDGGNRWLITAFDDSSSVHAQWATQGICFLPYAVVGTQIRGVWYSDTFPNWRGRYAQEGDNLLMHGNWANFGGSDGMVIDLFAGTSPKDEGGGQWTEWWNFGAYGTTVGFANARLSRAGKCTLPPNVATATQAELEKFGEENSSKVGPRLRRDGSTADRPSDPDSAPLPGEAQ